MTKSPEPRRLQRTAQDPAEQLGNTAGTEPVQAEPQDEPLAEQAAEPQSEPDPIAALKLEITEAIASPQTHTAAALADLCQVSSATIRNRWASAITEAISPYALRGPDGKYTALAAWAFGDYRATVAIDATTKSVWIAQVQTLLPSAQLALIEADEQITDEPEALAIVPLAPAEIVVDSDWLEQSGEQIDLNLDRIAASQADMATTLSSAGKALASSMRRLADQHSLTALEAYQAQIRNNMASILGASQATVGKQAVGGAA